MKLKNLTPLKQARVQLGAMLAIPALLLLGGCSQTPSHLIVAPEVMAANSGKYANKQAQLQVLDMRTGNHIVQISRPEKAAQLFSSQAPLKDIVAQSLTTQLNKQGMAMGPVATNAIEVSIDQALIKVDQQLMQYQVKSEIVLTVKVDNGISTLTNTFRNRGSSHGPLKADIAVLERDFNQQLALLLAQVIDNQEIQQFIR
ncbi:YajG family lipoprotein [Thalassomonas sp. RHCl1]|uniref:YajG family lipoprotein n=1 Tax=Thalassomonas sp. RHCl1 TaxID=2995320 RepID=UPI00248AAB4D|nr:YajG family lipoprotein [Thalassomonas sp. RHCl1]